MPDEDPAVESGENTPPENDDVFVTLAGEEDEEPADEAESEEQPEESETEEPDEKPEIETPNELETLKAELEKTRKDRDAAFYELRKATEKPKEKDDKPKFTKAQLIELYEQHKDDPAVAVQIMEEIASLVSKDKAESAVEDKDVAAIKENADKFLIERFPGYTKPDSPQYGELKKAKSLLRVNDHPLGDFLGVAGTVLMQLPSIVENVRKQAAEEALKGRSEETRKRQIKEQSPAKGKIKTKGAASDGMDANAKEVISKLGLSEAAAKAYVKMLKNAKNSTIMVNE